MYIYIYIHIYIYTPSSSQNSRRRCAKSQCAQGIQATGGRNSLICREMGKWTDEHTPFLSKVSLFPIIENGHQSIRDI